MSLFGEIARIGTRSVARNLRRSLITGSMVALGVAAIVFFRGYIASLQEMMVDMVVNTMTGELQVERQGYSAKGFAPIDLDLPTGDSLEKLIREVPGVLDVAPRLRFGALLVKGDRSTMVGVLAVDPEREKRVCPRGPGGGHSEEGQLDVERQTGLQGAPIAHFDDDTLLVGPVLAAGMGLEVGDTVTLLAQTQKGSTDAVDGVVRGIYRSGDPEQNKRLVVMSLGLAQRLLHMKGRATSLTVALQPGQTATAMAAQLQQRLKGAQPPVDVRTWKQLAPYYRDVITLQSDIMRIVMGMIFSLVLVGVINTMMMSVFERQREVGILMALGFRRRSIVWLFLAEALALGVVSAAVGAVVGIAAVALTHQLGIAFIVPAVGTIINRPVLDPWYLLLATGVAVLAALAAGLYPAYRASRLQPVEALRAL